MTLVLRSFHIIINNEHLHNHHKCLNHLRRMYANSSGLKHNEQSTQTVNNPDNRKIEQNSEMGSLHKIIKNKAEVSTTISDTEASENIKLDENLKGKASSIVAQAAESASKVKTSSQQVTENVKGYVFTRYFDYVKNYDILLEKKFPSAMKVYRVFFDGVKELFTDMKSLLKIHRIIKEKGIQSLNRKELELYMQMPKDMFKMAPTLFFSSLPVVGYAVFPLVLMFPRTFLTSHFWNDQQRYKFKQMEFQERLTYNRPVLRCLQSKLTNIEKHMKYKEFNNILGQLGSGTHPTVQQIIDIKDVFAQPPYSLIALSRKHVKYLVKMHGATRSIFKRHSLYEHAYLVHYMDKAINREGGVHNMPPEDISKACYIRGLNPIDLSNSEMVEWLRNWVHISTTIEGDHITLFLHLPILLAYNHPNNWRLIYDNKNNDTTNNKL